MSPALTKRVLLCATHRAARDYAAKQGWSFIECDTATTAQKLRGLCAKTEIIVIDTPFRFPDHAEILHILKTRNFTNVRHVTF